MPLWQGDFANTDDLLCISDVFWSGRSRLDQNVTRDWCVAELPAWEDAFKGNPVLCPRPIEHLHFICNTVRATTIIDPFLGSGTTAVAALHAGKKFIGIEKDEEFFEFACERVAKALRDQAA